MSKLIVKYWEIMYVVNFINMLTKREYYLKQYSLISAHGVDAPDFLYLIILRDCYKVHY